MLIDYKKANIYQKDNILVLKEVDFHVDEGEFIYVIGRVGAGKSTLLKTLYFELDVDEAENAFVLNHDLRGLKRKYIPALRRQMGIIFQDFQLLSDRTVHDNLAFVLKATGWKKKDEIEERIKDVLEDVDMLDFGDRFPYELSGGEQQRIAIARAILNKPKVIIADEPTGNLDSETAANILQLLRKITHTGTAVIMTTHNIPLLAQYPGIVYRCVDQHLEEITNDYNKIALYQEEDSADEVRTMDYSTREDLSMSYKKYKVKIDIAMKVMKFGGTSVGTPSRMMDVTKLVTKSGEPVFIVLSAMAGTTNSLVEISDYLYKKNPDGANEVINQMERKYMKHVEELYSTEEMKAQTREFIQSEMNYLRSFTKELFTSFEEKSIIAQGEMMSTNMVVNYMKEQGIKATLLNALDFMRTDKNSEPDPTYIKEKLNAIMEQNEGQQVYITQGFICRNAYGEIDNLQRGGSDYTASLIGAALNAEEIQIWTDIDGMHNNDPRVVEKTEPVHQLHFEEAAELAYFGAKILHPTCVQPAKYAGIPVRLLNTMQPDAEGTTISNQTEYGKIKAVAAKDNIIAIKIKSSRMLLATGFLRKVFEIFESYQTPIDMVCTSEVGVSMSIDNSSHLGEIVDELKKYGTVTVDTGMCIICVVGDLDWSNIGFETMVMDAMKNIPVRMISYGGSNYNISFLIKEEDKKRALQSLSDNLFNK